MNANLKRAILNTFLAGAFSMLAATAQAANLKVMSDSPLEPALTKVVDLYRQQTHNQVGLVFAYLTIVTGRWLFGRKAL